MSELTTSSIILSQPIELKFFDSSSTKQIDITRVDTDEVVLRLARKRFSMNNHMVFSDKDDNQLYEMKSKFSIRKSIVYVTHPNTEEIIYVMEKKNTYSFRDGRSFINVWKGEVEGGELVAKIQGDFRKKSFEIITMPDEKVVATASDSPKTVHVEEGDKKKKDYYVYIEAENDVHLLLLTVVAFQRQYYDRVESRAAGAAGAGAGAF